MCDSGSEGGPRDGSDAPKTEAPDFLDVLASLGKAALEDLGTIDDAFDRDGFSPMDEVGSMIEERATLYARLSHQKAFNLLTREAFVGRATKLRDLRRRVVAMSRWFDAMKDVTVILNQK